MSSPVWFRATLPGPSRTGLRAPCRRVRWRPEKLVRAWFAPRVSALDLDLESPEAARELAAALTTLDTKMAIGLSGFEAVEERARYELGMVRQDEVFFQVLPPGSVAQPAPKLVPEQGEKASARPAAKTETGKGEKADAKAASANAPAAAAASN